MKLNKFVHESYNVNNVSKRPSAQTMDEEDPELAADNKKLK